MKNKICFLFSLLLFSFSINAQTDSTFKPEKLPKFKGGMDAWIRFVEANIDRDLMVKNGAPSGQYQVIASFIVHEDGSVSDIKIEKDPGYGAAKELERFLYRSNKKWEPAIDKGKVIAYRHKQSLTLLSQ